MNPPFFNKAKNNPHFQRFNLIKPHIGRLTLGFIVLIITVVIQLSYPKAIAYFIDNSISQKETSWLTWAALIMFFVLLLQAIATALRYYLFASTGSMIVTKVRQLLYGAIIRQEIGFFDSRSVGELTNRLSSDVEILQDTLSMSLAIAIRSFITCVGATIMLILLSPELSLLMIVVVPLAIFAAGWVGRRISRISKSIQESLARCGQIAQETFSNIRLVHAFTQETLEQEKYDQATKKSLDFSIDSTRLLAGFQGASNFVQYLALLVILWVGGKLVASQSLSMGSLTSFILYTGMAASSAAALSSFWGEWMKSIGATERIFELLNRTPQTRTDMETNIHHLNGDLEFKNITFSYPSRLEQEALKSFNLKIAAGEKIAIVGPSGAGKSTVANLILGFYIPSAGHLTFDGIRSDQLSLSDIRKHIAIVEQEPSLFSGSIFDNIRYALPDPQVDDEAIFKVAKLANAHDFISSFPQGYATLLGDRGVQLSGGQKQRIAIARALLRNPKILILDEATSALDSESEHQVQKALERLMQNRTSIIIAHRYSTIINAKRLIVMQQGKIIQTGTHDQLIQDPKGLYYRLIKNQIHHQYPVSSKTIQKHSLENTPNN